MISLDDIPTAFEPPADARPSGVVAMIRSIRPSRRAVLRGLVVGAAAAALVPIDWYLTRRAAAAAPGPSDEYLTCPKDYDEEATNWPRGGPAVCAGGWRRGTFPCSGGYHIEGSHYEEGAGYESMRVTTDCHGRNAWRWKGYRCSDAVTNAAFTDGLEYHGVTIAICSLPSGAE
ncbi:hypothetical protein [Pseudonocardia sp. TRM90224]|uniref:hypothetical protein n=1 Tax=Pseudonocardia sp. TRM90224 TaxID=2812678 RepID=UPI001E5EACB6|nr:hypothetical protein [Pseudonocardia sp. TRM90224]